MHMIHLERCSSKKRLIYIQSWNIQLAVITEHPLTITARWPWLFTICGYTNWRSLKWNRRSCIFLEWSACTGKQWTKLTGSEERVTSICPTQFFLLPYIAVLCQYLVTWPSVAQQALKQKKMTIMFPSSSHVTATDMAILTAKRNFNASIRSSLSSEWNKTRTNTEVHRKDSLIASLARVNRWTKIYSGSSCF